MRILKSFLVGKLIQQNNDAVDRAAFAHSGQEATRLASSDPKGDPAHDAILFQDVSGICFGKHYELQFEMSGETTRANASVNARVIWLDQNKNILGSGLQITITEDSLPDIKTGAWTTFQGVTNASPPQTQFARVRFKSMVVRVLTLLTWMMCLLNRQQMGEMKFEQ